MILLHLINAKDKEIETLLPVYPRESKEEDAGPSPPRERGDIRTQRGSKEVSITSLKEIQRT